MGVTWGHTAMHGVMISWKIVVVAVTWGVCRLVWILIRPTTTGNLVCFILLRKVSTGEAGILMVLV